jgi:hypothetical protein
MSVSARVTDEPNEAFLEFVTGTAIRRGRTRPDSYIIVKRGNKYRIHEDASSYAATSATSAHVVIGAIVKRFDPDARALEGKAASFRTPQEAEAYVKRWL